MSKPPFVLLVNPWITDFAAYDLWAKPLGLLILGALLREGGVGVELLDCLDRRDPETLNHPEIIPGRDGFFGTGKYPKIPIPTPSPLKTLSRTYYRYGIHPESLQKKLASLPTPDLVCVTSFMTYWYPGVQETIRYIKEAFPRTPVWLGGTYAKLCSNHARKTSGADWVCTEPLAQVAHRIQSLLDQPMENLDHWKSPTLWPPPAVDLVESLTYAPVLVSLGCPYRCPYCASQTLQPEWVRLKADVILRQILDIHRRTGIRDFAFYDDALLLVGAPVLRTILERIIEENLKLRFHTPNALHVRALTDFDWCRLLYESGFTTVRLGLETTRPEKQKEWGGKVEQEMFFRAVENLHKAGYAPQRIGVYLLCGLPGQTVEEVAESIETVRRAGATPYLAEFSPIPGTPIWKEAVRISPFPLADEPLTHNNTFFACRRPDFTLEDLQTLKQIALKARQSVPKTPTIDVYRSGAAD